MFKNKRNGWQVGLLMVGLFFVILIWQERSATAAEVTGGSGIYMDAEGNMYMTTYDKIATSSTRYRTIGWTIRRSNAGGETVRVKLAKYKPETVDPANPQYCYNYYRIPKELLYQKIASTSAEWASSLYGSGGTIYLDAIMTVVEGGQVLGTLSDSGSISGEVYTTYAGIAGARGWADKEALKTHFGKAIYFGGNASLLEMEYWVDDKSDVTAENTAYISSAEFDVATAIPSGEAVTVRASLEKYFYTIVYEKHSGKEKLPIIAEITYTLKWEGGTEEVIVRREYEIERDYSYWRIRDFHFASLDAVTVENAALPEGVYRGIGFSQPAISLTQNQAEYCKFPEKEVRINGGIIEGEAEKPEIPEMPKSTIEKKVGKIKVRNDGLVVDGEVLLDSSWALKETSGPKPMKGKTVSHVSKALTLPYQLANTDYTTKAYGTYSIYNGGTERVSILNINDVSIHTPVLCIGKISDEKGFNQQITPTPYPSLILGRTFTVSIQTKGVHRNQKGYGARDYGKYGGTYQVRFPFVVSYDGTQIAADTWITLKQRSAGFFLPVSVKEGTYEVVYRSIAYNGTAESPKERTANLQRSNYVAYDVVKVSVVGRLSDFQITNVVDYPRWKEVFWKEDGSATGYVYFAGVSDKNGIKQREAGDKFLLPVLAGSHTDAMVDTVPGLGYQQCFAVQTVGNMSDAGDRIYIEPSFFWMRMDGREQRRVKLYEYEDLSEFGEGFWLTAENREILESGVQRWSGSYQIPPNVYVVDDEVDLQEYVTQKGRIKTTDEVFLKNGYVVVHFDITTYDAEQGQKESPALSYANLRNARNGYCNMWSVEGYQRMRTDVHGVHFVLSEGDVMVFGQENHMWTDYNVVGTH